ncbi:hypothetical protein TRFO_15274 [Tritrichomonas foetus]|uniref:BTB domain-containing protein n=1 Tax=Tritrichomonas foetus TaxID=1144522 RepID=A0A1J4KXR9_9EUKA|nr:hypothetical protein TRFO_15274 [Tritrichomonas foetus]|eukprot:OHT14357.1 hypothetical protein TRFO_15274 [Tritrichomonas foetus]
MIVPLSNELGKKEFHFFISLFMFQFELFSTDYNSRYITLEEEEDFDDDDDDIDFDSYEYELSGLERSNRTPSSINNTNLLKKEKPKIFVVYVNEKKYYFDQNLLMMASDVISKFCQENPGCQKYHFDFNDECNIMKKIENLFQFKFETFLISEKMAMENIIGAFRFNCFDILTNNMNGPISFPMKLQMPAWIYKEIKNNSLQQLKIQTLKKVYKCKTYGILSSTTIKAFFNENPEVDTFCYEFKDDNHEFQLISDYLNLGTIMINPSNMNLVYDIATELQISSLLKKVEKFVNKLEAQRKIIEENFSIVEPVEQLFDLLKNINSMEIIEITHQILLSIWPYSKDNIREMVSCFLFLLNIICPFIRKYYNYVLLLITRKENPIIYIFLFHFFLIIYFIHFIRILHFYIY